MKLKITTLTEKKRISNKTFGGLLIFALLLCGDLIYGQMLVPYSGSNTLTCGTNTVLMDHAGTGGYNNNAEGFSVLDAGFGAAITISGTYDTETNFDYIYIYSGAGTGGTLIQTLNGSGSYNFTGAAGQTLTVRFHSDGSVTYTGFNFNISYSGPCFATPCSGIPPANSVTTPTYAICPNTSGGVGLASTYSVGGLTFQWYSSTFSNVGPYTAVPGATNNSMTTPTLATQTWYQAVVTCSNGGGTVIATPAAVSVQAVTTSSVPYFEDFEGIVGNNKLPNCSWSAPTLGSGELTYITSNAQGRTPRSGSKFASFYYSPGGTNYFYTNGIWMDANVTYSASVWFQTEYYGYNNWSDFSIMLGPNQSTTGLVTIASTNGPAISNVYKSISNTFTVATSGIYYVAVSGTGNTSSSAQYLSWDDLRIEVPCALNSPTMNVTANTTTICEGQSVNLTAAGADTFTWSTGDNNASINPVPLQLGMNYFQVTGKVAISGCTATVNQPVFVNPAPQINIIGNNQTVCSGKPVILTAFGADTYSWNTGGNGNITTVMPTAGTSYTVLGSNSYGCTSSASYSVTVNTLPTVNASADRASMCIGESVTLTGGGAVSYQWLSSAQFKLLGNPIVVSPTSSGTYTLTGADANGCESTAIVAIGVDACTGITEVGKGTDVRVYPNPTTGAFVIELNDQSLKSIEVTDMMGRIVENTVTAQKKVSIDINNRASGIYYVKVVSGDNVSVIKIVKE
jgi:hypothetical protein